MQEVLVSATRSGLRKLVEYFNHFILNDIEDEAISLPVTDSRFLLTEDKEKLLKHVLGRFSQRDEPDEAQPLCERVPNKLLSEYKTFIQSVFDRKFAHVYEHIRFIAFTERMVSFVCNKYCWTSALENDFKGTNAETLQILERLLDKGVFFQTLHTWINICGEPEMADDAAVAKAFFDFIKHQRTKGK